MEAVPAPDDGVFETVRVAFGRAVVLDRHLARLVRGAASLGLPAPDVAQLRGAVGEVLAAAAIDRGRLRVTWTAVGPVIAVGPAAPVEGPVDVHVVPWPRNERSAVGGVKSTSYTANWLALAEARRHGAGEAIFADTEGRLCEGSGSNVVVGLGGHLVTPSLITGALGGIGRELVLESTDVVEGELPLSALHDADEAFLTSSIRGVQPIRAVDGQPLPRCPGPLTATAARAVAELLAASLDDQRR